MSTEEQRRKNLAKQKRFQARHPNYQKDKIAQKKINKLPKFILPGKYRTFELCDPFDSEKLPRVVAYCEINIKPVWSRLWLVRHYSKSYWAQWLCKLESLGSEPLERETPWNIGVIYPVSKFIASLAVQSRIKDINTIMTKEPNWLLRNCKEKKAKPVGCLTPQNTILHFDTIKEAQQKTPFTRLTIADAVYEIKTINGYTWFDD